MHQKLIRVAGVLFLLLFAATALAQDEPEREIPATADQPIGDVEVIEVVETGEAVVGVARVVEEDEDEEDDALAIDGADGDAIDVEGEGRR